MKQQAHTKPPVKLWIDSGAFSVWQAGGKGPKVEPISLPAYIDFIKQREHLIECYISLDEMPRASRHVWGGTSARQLDELPEISFSQNADMLALQDQFFDLSVLAALTVTCQMPHILIANNEQGSVLGHTRINLTPYSGCHLSSFSPRYLQRACEN
jgi:hypothetical protein